MSELVHLETTGEVATITLDSPRNRNALSRQLVTEFSERLATADSTADVRVVLVRSSERVFCSGADLSEAKDGGMEEGSVRLVRLLRQIATLSKPVVVRLDGPVRAGGLGIVGAADVVVSAATVTFALTEVRLALAPAIISLTLLPRLDPRAASELFLTGRGFDAHEAAAIGMVTRTVSEPELDGAVDAVIAELVQGYPQGLRETKSLLNRDLVARIDDLGDEVARQSAVLFDSDEAKAAMSAFLERKKS